MANDSAGSSSNLECQEVLSAFNSFFQMLYENEWLSQSSKEEIRNCLLSARNIEKILERLKYNGSFEDFMNLVPNLYGHSLDQICNACDITFCMVMTSSGVPLPCVRICIDEYLKLCGPERFKIVLASVIFSSEIYRVLLDYIATSSDDELEKNQISLQSHLFINLWKTETDIKTLKDKFYKWLKTDHSGKNIAVAMQVVNLEENSSLVSFCLVHVLIKILQERGDTAVLFCKIFIQFPMIRMAVSKSSDLLHGVLEFLKTTAKWMEVTASFSYMSREEGPCKALKFDELITLINLIHDVGGSASEKVDKFLLKQKNSEGCTFWDDIEMQLKRPIGFNSVFE